MKFISNWLNLFKPTTLEEDAEKQAKIAVEDIAQSESTILRAQYIKHMAEWKLKAIADWSNKTSKTIDLDFQSQKLPGSNPYPWEP